MSESQGRDLKPPEDGIFYENFGFGTFFWYHNFQNEIDAWESTVSWEFYSAFVLLPPGQGEFLELSCPTLNQLFQV